MHVLTDSGAVLYDPDQQKVLTSRQLCPHTVFIRIEFDDTDTADSYFAALLGDQDYALKHLVDPDNASNQLIAVYSSEDGGNLFGVSIPSADFFNEWLDVTLNFSRLDDENVNITLTVAGHGIASGTGPAPTASFGGQYFFYVGHYPSCADSPCNANCEDCEAHRTVQLASLIPNPDTAEESFSFPTDSFDSLNGDISLVAGELRIDAVDGSEDGYAEKDLLPRYNLDCSPPGGACCHVGVCDDNVLQDDCPFPNTFLGAGTVCAVDSCATGACCEGESCFNSDGSYCSYFGGVYHGNGSTCDPNPCAEPGCCALYSNPFYNPDDGFCYTYYKYNFCGGFGYDWSGITDCDVAWSSFTCSYVSACDDPPSEFPETHCVATSEPDGFGGCVFNEDCGGGGDCYSIPHYNVVVEYLLEGPCVL